MTLAACYLRRGTILTAHMHNLECLPVLYYLFCTIYLFKRFLSVYLFYSHDVTARASERERDNCGQTCNS
jgi:hypothetical protein